MTLETELSDALHESFRAALVLTGSVERAEGAVTNALATLGPDCSADSLLLETVRAAVQHSPASDEGPSILPVELRALSLLSPTCRHCFVLRALLGLGVDACSKILGLSRDEVDEAFCESLLDLPQAVGTFLPAIKVQGTISK